MKKIIYILIFLISIFSFSANSGDMIRTFNPEVANKYGPIVDKYSKQLGVDPKVVVAIMARETGGRNLGHSSEQLNPEKRANVDRQPMGVMQLGKEEMINGLMMTGMSKAQATKLASEENRKNPELNVRAGVGFYAYHLKKSCKGDVACAVGSYNSGAAGHRSFLRGKGSNARKDEASHYLVDVNYKVKILDKLNKEGSITEKEKRLMKNGIDTRKERNKYREAMNELRGNNKSPVNLDDFNSNYDETGNYDDSKNAKVTYISDASFDWDGIASNIANTVYSSLQKIKGVGLIIISLLFAIQVLIDSLHSLANWNLKSFLGTFFKRILAFGTYTFIISKILDGTLMKIFEDISYGMIRLLTRENGVQKLSNIWAMKDKITATFWEAFSNLWGISSIIPSELTKDLTASIILIIIIVIFNIVFFIMMLNLLKALIFFQFALGMSTILLPMGILDSTKQYYNIGKVLSLAINFMIKLISINFLAFIIMKVLTENSSALNISNVSNAISDGGIMTFLVLIMVMGSLMTKVEVQF